MDDKNLSQILLKNKLLSKSQLAALEKETKEKKTDLYHLLLDRGLLTDEKLGAAVANHYGVPFIRLGKITIPPETLNIIPEVVAKNRMCVAFERGKGGLKIALVDPEDLETIEFTQKKTGDKAIPHYATPKDMETTFRHYQKDIQKEFARLIEESAAIALERGKPTEIPIIKIVDLMLSYGEQNNASDIHIEPRETESLIRYRIDGMLHDVATLPKETHSEITTRIKVMANLRTDEHHAAQDGKLIFRIGMDLPREKQTKLDVRVSVMPITYGEKVVLRLLSARVRRLSFEDMGFEEEDLKKLKRAYEKPYGMILATGPTGSGKTTTMYAVLKVLNKRNVNITTIEDPVEYDMEGVNQIQVNPKTNLTFAQGLRSIVRQDPDIILVGEIRDPETANIAINAAMTGHLLLSTMHANNSATSIIRLLDMGVEPFLVASTLNVIIAQRLVRMLCQNCQKKEQVSARELKERVPAEAVAQYLGKGDKITVWTAQGCPACQQTGYAGRIGIHEILLVDDEIRQAIIDQKDAETIQRMAGRKGMTPMLENGLKKVQKGVTTIEEILRAIKE
jgi:type IV pilus assembly protein PilB